ncbi:hypothetical protein ACFFK0_30210 [Paenibacillus chartarius]|uniref:Transporter n=1 Tax=Paenibacillus chartarius TaxID=747481 RepID=A0ABV6DVK1_9BACL
MSVEWLGLHGVFVLFIAAIIGFMIARRDTTIVCLAGILVLGLVATYSLSESVSGVFNSFIYAIKELAGTILVISIIVGMSAVLTRSGIHETMIAPVSRWVRSPGLAFWITGIVMLVISLFFWPTPAVALVGAVLLPAAIRAGLPAVGVAVAINLFGHGIALSGDYIIQGAPKLTADAAGIPVGDVIEASIPLVIIMGVVTTVIAFLDLRKDMKTGKGVFPSPFKGSTGLNDDLPFSIHSLKPALTLKQKRWLSVMIVASFALDVIAMLTMKLQGGDATALIGGTALIILVIVSLMTHRGQGLEKTTGYLIEGLQFGFRVFGPVIPVAAFFYLGDAALKELYGSVLPDGSTGIVNDLGVALAQHVPVNPAVSAVTVTMAGAITGLDGSGFSGISLAGSIAHLFGAALGTGIDTLTALGQIAAIWVGGGTLVPWALIPAAAICGVSPFELARRNLKPVAIGLAVTTIAAMFIL